ncbi:restriction endonuclease subunit S [Moraxella catarrhalis]|uniref:restriction endonuclease subunit S n=1 Tax=Moraxella catarrhalis TaxID=480 RepID=UPI0007E44FC3|nr:restriction endonuclease subunit S [Moraxella catarrhalis]OAV25995.1 Type I restriction-modification system, specificity subunit S [Moraxella catarrhalis]
MAQHSFLQNLLQGQAVEWKTLGEVCDILDNLRKPIKASLRLAGSNPYYGANNIQDYVDGFTHDGEYVLIAEDGSSSLENYSIQWATGKFWANNHVHVVSAKECLNNRFLFHFLKKMNFIPYLTGGTRAKLTKAKMIEIQIPIPPLSVQSQIVQILDTFTELNDQLTAELSMRQKQYQYYRNKLLTFDFEAVQSLATASDSERQRMALVWKTLGEVSREFGRGKSKHRPRNDERLYGGGIPFIQTGDIRGSAKKIKTYNQTYSDFGLAQSKLWKKDTLCITIAANIAETAILDFDACFPDSIIGFVADPKQVDVNYIYYLLQSLKTKLQSYSTGSAQENLNLAAFEDLLFPIPPLSEQARIVTILDKFDTLVNSISEGLPKEIKLRQKQYEYYRERLLAF